MSGIAWDCSHGDAAFQSIPATSVATIHTVFQDSSGAAQSQNLAGKNVRYVIKPASLSGTPGRVLLRISFKTGSTVPVGAIQEAWIGTGDGTTEYFFSDDEQPITWNGGNSTLTLTAANTTYVSDWIQFRTFTPTSNLVIALYFSGSTVIALSDTNNANVDEWVLPSRISYASETQPKNTEPAFSETQTAVTWTKTVGLVDGLVKVEQQLCIAALDSNLVKITNPGGSPTVSSFGTCQQTTWEVDFDANINLVDNQPALTLLSSANGMRTTKTGDFGKYRADANGNVTELSFDSYGGGGGGATTDGTVTTANVSVLQSQVATLRAQMASLLAAITPSGNSITVGGNITANANIGANGNVNAGANISAGTSVIAGTDVIANSNVRSLNNVYANWGSGVQVTLLTHTHTITLANQTNAPDEPS